MPSSRCAAAAASAPARSWSASDRGRLAAVLIVLIALGATACPASDRTIGSTTDAVEANAVVTKVVDGDTLDVDTGGHEVRIRMIGFNTPESVDPRRPVECFGKEASKHLATLSPVGTDVRLERDVEEHDRYGRTLAYVYRSSDGLFLNLQMVGDGYAHSLSIAPNVAFADRFLEAERSARDADLGLWAACPTVPTVPSAGSAG